MTNTSPAVAERVPKGRSKVAAGGVPRSTDAVTTRLPSGPGSSAASVDSPLEPAGSTVPLGLAPVAGSDGVIPEICGQLVALQRQRVFCIRVQSKLDRAVEAYIRVELGYNTHLPEAERKKLSAEARRIKRSIEKGEGHPSRADNGQNSRADPFSMFVLNSMSSRKPWDDLRAGAEKRMETLAKRLPAWPWVETIKGVSAKGLAIIVGEAGDLSNYPDRSRLQKRLGLGVIDGHRQGAPGKDASAETWIAHGYVARRRAEIWALLDDVMIRAQWRGHIKDDDGKVVLDEAGEIAGPAHAIGPYGEFYRRKKAEYIERKHPAPDRAARRYAAKMFIKHLWQAWRRAENYAT